jgi:hypothetical protein
LIIAVYNERYLSIFADCVMKSFKPQGIWHGFWFTSYFFHTFD